MVMQNIIKTIKLFLIINIIIYTPSNAKMYKVYDVTQQYLDSKALKNQQSN